MSLASFLTISWPLAVRVPTKTSDLLCVDYSMKRSNISHDDVSTSSSLTVAVSPSDSRLYQYSRPPPPYQYQQQYMSLSPDHGLTPSSEAVKPPLQPAVAATTASPTPASRTTSPELLVIPAEPRRRAGSRSKGTVK